MSNDRSELSSIQVLSFFFSRKILKIVLSIDKIASGAKKKRELRLVLELGFNLNTCEDGVVVHSVLFPAEVSRFCVQLIEIQTFEGLLHNLLEISTP